MDFALSGVSGVHLAGVELDRIRSYEDLTALDVARVAAAASRRQMPLRFDLHLLAENPPDNAEARLLGMDWTLLLEGTETVSGVLDRELVLPPGVPTGFPIAIELDLYAFFESNARNLTELALSLAGQGGAAKNVSLRATPVVETALGPIRYPTPITIVSGEVGGRQERVGEHPR